MGRRTPRAAESSGNVARLSLRAERIHVQGVDSRHSCERRGKLDRKVNSSARPDPPIGRRWEHSSGQPPDIVGHPRRPEHSDPCVKPNSDEKI